MQTGFKLFDISPVQGMENMSAPNRIALKLSGEDGCVSEEAAAGFLEMMSALLALQPEQVQHSLDQLDWVPLGDAAQEGLAPLIDLTDTQNQKTSMLTSLFQMTLNGSETVEDVCRKWSQPVSRPDSADAGNAAAPAGDQAAAGAIKEHLLATFSGETAEDDGTGPGDLLAQGVSDRQKSVMAGISEEAEKGTNLLKNTEPALAKTEAGQAAPQEQVPEFLRRWLASGKSHEHLVEARQPAGVETTDSTSQMDPVAQETQTGDSVRLRNLNSRSRTENDFQAKKAETLIKEKAVLKDERPSSQIHARPFSSQVDRSDALPKETPAPELSREMQSDVIRQIVQKMTFRSEGRQARMQIKLKPEFLGEIRMQVMTENQQVTVRMTADSQAVKEIIEQNMHQLKNELQQHGLQIEKFEVFVGQDGDGWGNHSQQPAFQQTRQRRSYRMSRPDRSQSNGNGDPDGTVIDSERNGQQRHQQVNEIDYFA